MYMSIHCCQGQRYVIFYDASLRTFVVIVVYMFTISCKRVHGICVYPWGINLYTLVKYLCPMFRFMVLSVDSSHCLNSAYKLISLKDEANFYYEPL